MFIYNTHQTNNGSSIASKPHSDFYRKQKHQALAISLYTPHTRLSSSLSSSYVYMNRQARVALGDRIRNSLQLTALRLKPSRLLGVQALTLHYP